MERKPLMLTPKSKRGMSLGDLYPVILTIALIAILLAVVLYVLSELGEAIPTKTDAFTTNETLTIVNTTGTTEAITAAGYCGFTSWNRTLVFNASSDAELVEGTDYTVNTANGTLFNASGTGGESWLVTGTYAWGGEACDVTENVTDDFSDFVPWIGVILLIVAAAIVLGIVIRSFAGGKRI